MPIRNILVAYNATRAAEAALTLARLLAREHDAHLTGILAHGLPTVLYSYGGHLPQSAMDALDEADRAHRAEVRRAFETATADVNAERLHYLDVFGDVDSRLMEIAHSYDLLVTGTGAPQKGFGHMECHPDTLARHAGRPVLVVPAGFTAETLPRRALLAWDNRRAAARALSDALALELGTQALDVLSVGPGTAASAMQAGVLEHLARHDIPAQPHRKPRGKRGVAAAILETLEETGAEMLVMGAYEHPKLAEDLFGGTTNTLLESTPVPVLLSH